MRKVKRGGRRGAGKASAGGASKPKKPQSAARSAAAFSTANEVAGDVTGEDQLIASSLSLHELFQQQTRQILDRSDLEEEQKQHILVAMSCPCCGAGAMAFTAKLRR